MSVIRVKKQRGEFTVLHTGFLENPKLSAKAKGILAYLLSKPDGWTACQYDVERVMADGRASIRSGFAELLEAGYMRRWRENDPETGHLGWLVEVYETPREPLEVEAESSEAIDSSEADGGSADVVKTEVGFSDVGLTDGGSLGIQSNKDSFNASLPTSTNTSLLREGERKKKIGSPPQPGSLSKDEDFLGLNQAPGGGGEKGKHTALGAGATTPYEVQNFFLERTSSDFCRRYRNDLNRWYDEHNRATLEVLIRAARERSVGRWDYYLADLLNGLHKLEPAKVGTPITDRLRQLYASDLSN